MRTLVLAGVYPWPATDGYRLRMHNMILGLAEIGDVDFFCAQAWHEDIEADAPSGINVFTTQGEPTSRPTRVSRWVTERVPRIMLNRTVTTVRRQLSEWASDDYDLVYYSYLDNWWLFGDLFELPSICDLELEHLKTRANRKLRPSTRNPASWAKWLATQPVEWVDEKRFEQVQLECAADVDVVTLCSDLDVKRSGMANAVTIPNGYELSWEPRLDRADQVGEPPTLSFVGLQSYAPNADASRWMATQILPRVRRAIPDATFRIVGRRGELLSDLAEVPGVVITGAVDDLQDEMARADAAVVPIRFGSGTRLKVSEALANRIPVVTTTIGCEGVDVVNGRHALIADDDESFAAACVQVLRDKELRKRLISEGAELYETRYQWSLIRTQLADLARSVAGSVPI